MLACVRGEGNAARVRKRCFCSYHEKKSAACGVIDHRRRRHDTNLPRILASWGKSPRCLAREFAQGLPMLAAQMGQSRGCQRIGRFGCVAAEFDPAGQSTFCRSIICIKRTGRKHGRLAQEKQIIGRWNPAGEHVWLA